MWSLSTCKLNSNMGKMEYDGLTTLVFTLFTFCRFIGGIKAMEDTQAYAFFSFLPPFCLLLLPHLFNDIFPTKLFFLKNTILDIMYVLISVWCSCFFCLYYVHIVTFLVWTLKLFSLLFKLSFFQISFTNQITCWHAYVSN